MRDIRHAHLARRVVDAKVEQEAAARRDGEPSREREALQLEGRHRVEAADGGTKEVEPKDERREARLDDREAGYGGAEDDGPRGVGGEAAGGNGEERLVDLINLHVVDLVDADDEEVTQQQSHHAHGCSWHQRWQQAQVHWGFHQSAADAREAREQGAPNRVWSTEFVHRVDAARDGGGSSLRNCDLRQLLCIEDAVRLSIGHGSPRRACPCRSQRPQGRGAEGGAADGQHQHEREP